MTEKQVKWTEAQARAIETRGCNLLVSASAGTGKTATLVERCLRLITAKEPVDIDRLLVVTFTEAAAAEMRNRLSEELRKRIEANPTDKNLRRQLVLLDRASISTLHSYALRVLQEYFFWLDDLDPNFRVLDPEEAALLRYETLDEVFEELYTDQHERGRRFRELVTRYGQNGDDGPVRSVVLQLSEFMRSLPRPDDWKSKVLSAYPTPDDSRPFEEMGHWYERFIEGLREALERLERKARETLETALLPAAVARHFSSVAVALSGFRNLLLIASYESAREEINEYKFPMLSLKGLDEKLQETLRDLNDGIRESMRKIRQNWAALSSEQWAETLRATRPLVEALLDVVECFDSAYGDAKRERAALDFQDLERFCFDLLVDAVSSRERPAPSPVQREIRNRFEEVLVDEYQDISPVQDAIVELSSRHGESGRAANLFMVGDVKQSIYRFRLAEPSLFLKRFHEYSPNAGWGQAMRIDLSDNHRSRAKLLLALNSVFRQVMIADVGEIVYDEAAQLRGGFNYPREIPPQCPPPTDGVPVEVHLFDRATEGMDESDGEENQESEVKSQKSADNNERVELEPTEIEALWAAERIKRMVEGKEFSIWDCGQKCYRAVRYRDIAVLLRTVRHNAEAWARMLRDASIPCYAESAGGFLEATELKDMLSLLAALDNPHQDIAVATVLRSPLVGLDEDDLARIRIHQRNGGFFSAVLAYAARGPNEHLRQRLSDFLAQMENWRSMVRRGSLAQAIWAIYNETGYLDYVSAMDGGTQRRANLIGLYDRARQFDEFSRRGLGRFLEFIRQLQDAEGELASPPAQSEAEDTVRIMSIHKSKGLEFPVVFLADIARVFNFQSARGDLVVDRDLGLGVRNVDTDRAIKYPTAAHLVVGRQIERETMAEEMRLLYVAMTRAREKLVLCGSVRFDAALGKWLRFADDQESAVGPLDDLTVRSAKSFADWLGPALGRLGCLDESNAGNERFFQVEFHRADEWQGRQPTRPKPVEKILHDMAAMKPVSPPPHDHDLVAQVAERLNWRYRWQPLTEMRGKFSVSELKRRFEIGREADESVGRFLAAPQPRKPAFLMAEETTAPTLTAAERGTAFHTVMRCLDFESATDGEAVRKQIEEMEARGILSATEAAAVDVEAIARFSDSPLGKEMKQRAGHVWRELPFSLAVSDLSDLSDASDLSDQAWQDESVHLQGIIDCLIERPDGFVLVDFKTDQVAPEQAGGRAERYRFQLQLYTRAVETIFRRPVVARVLYFLRPAVAVEL